MDYGFTSKCLGPESLNLVKCPGKAVLKRGKEDKLFSFERRWEN